VTAVDDRLVITEPGVYPMSHAEYLADPVPGGSLSSSGARMLLPPSCPALYRYRQDHPEHKDVFDVGTAAHQLVLGTGPEIVVVDAPDWRSKAAKEARDEARTAGDVALLLDDYSRVVFMAEAIRRHPLAGPLLARSDVQPEQTLIWHDGEFGIWRRARLDAHRSASRRLLVTDYKTARSADPGQFARSAASYGYHAQASWYLDAVQAVLGERDAAFLFVVQEKEPPYLVTVCELDYPSVQAGHALNRRAMEVYRDCREADVWPGYTDDVALISLPAWALGSREDW
jgi:hypothetical protein